MSSTPRRARDLLEAYNAMLQTNSNVGMTCLLNEAGCSLLAAVETGDIGEFSDLLAIEGVDIDTKDTPHWPHWGRTAVMWACIVGRLDILEYLMSKGANINGKDECDYNCLMLACESGHLDVVKLLMSKGANFNDKCNVGHNCVMKACSGGHLDIVKFLMFKGANINDKSIGSFSCLMKVCSHGYLDIMDFILYEGARIHGFNIHGDTCFTLARINDDVSVLYHLHYWPTTMAILVLQELAIIYIIDSESVIDLHQYLGSPEYLMLDDGHYY